MSYNDYNDRSEYGRGGGGGGGYGRDEYSDNRRDNYGGGRQEYGGGRQEYGGGRDDGYDNRGGDYGSGRRNDNYESRGGRQEHGGGDRYNDTRYDDTPQNRYSHQDDDYSSAVSHAQKHDDDSDKNSSFFSQAASFLNQNKDRVSSNSDIDEEQAVKAHKSLFGGGGDSNQQHDSQSVGAGSAIEALKMFTQGGGGSGLGGGGDEKSKLIGMAMAQASKAWDQQGGNASGDKQSAINSAAEMALKMYMKNQGGSGLGGTGGPSGLLSLASKFL
ncbi:hypothetical protein Plec18167_004062 [Paecilomyces lecythidis]|uniref:DUF7721 domain-containing protein n=1 Tax=Paecilomyces lecythidis TaxID=3004212 RepID=A0ABR3XUD1_9EURO